MIRSLIRLKTPEHEFWVDKETSWVCLKGDCEERGHSYLTPIRLVIDDIEKFLRNKVEMY